MDLVDEDDRPHAHQAVVLRLLHHGADLLDAARDGGKVDKFRARPVRDDLRERGLADAGRAPEDHRGDLVALDQAAKYFARANQVRLAGELFERARAEPRRERLGDFRIKQGHLFHHYSLLSLYYDIKFDKPVPTVLFYNTCRFCDSGRPACGADARNSRYRQSLPARRRVLIPSHSSQN